MTQFNWSDKFVPYGKGKKAGFGSLKDAPLAEVLKAYRRNVAKRYRVIDADMMEKLLPTGRLWISTKLDGELWYLVKRQGEVALCAYNGRVLMDIPVVDEAKKLLAAVGDVVIAGELVAPPPTGRPRCHHVGTAVASEDGADKLRFFAFDLAELGNESQVNQVYDKRLEKIQSWFGKGDLVSVVTTVEGSPTDALSYYREWVGTQRFEGIVVRGEQGFTYKIKPTFSIDAIVVAYGSRILTGTPQLREMTIAIRRDDGRLHIVGSVGGGFAEADRVAWHTRLSAMEVPSSFRMANRDGTLCRFVRPEIVVEIQCNDLVESDANDTPIRRMTLAYDGTAGYSAAGDGAIASMLSPVFLRERTDKVPDAANVGLDQITSRLPIDAADEPVVSRAAAKVLDRKAFVKGETSVRKYVILDADKGGSNQYPPFLVYTTDYSGGRAEPMKAAIRPCSSLAAAQKYVAEWLEENIKRGWVEAGTAPVAAAPAKAKPKAKVAAEPSADGAVEEAPKPKSRAKKPSPEAV